MVQQLAKKVLNGKGLRAFAASPSLAQDKQIHSEKVTSHKSQIRNVLQPQNISAGPALEEASAQPLKQHN